MNSQEYVRLQKGGWDMGLLIFVECVSEYNGHLYGSRYPYLTVGEC